MEPQGSPILGPVVLDVCGQRGEGADQEEALAGPGPEAGLGCFLRQPPRVPALPWALPGC